MPLWGRARAKDPDFPAALRKFGRVEAIFLSALFKDLSRRSTVKSIEKQTFLLALPLPGILAHHLFAVFDRKKDGVLDFEEFVVGLARLLRNDEPEARTLLLYELFDLGADKGLTKAKLRTSLKTAYYSYVPQSSTGNGETTCQAIDKLTEKLVRDAFRHAASTTLTYQEFAAWTANHQDVVENVFGLPAIQALKRELDRHRRLQMTAKGEETLPRGLLIGESQAGFKLSSFVTRYYVIHQNYLYKYESSSSTEPLGAYYIPGATIEPVYDVDKLAFSQDYSANLQSGFSKSVTPESKSDLGLASQFSSSALSPLLKQKRVQRQSIRDNHVSLMSSTESSPSSVSLALLDEAESYMTYGFSITWPDGRYRKVLYASSEAQQHMWINELQKAAKMQNIKDTFAIDRSKRLGKGSFASVYKAWDTANGESYAVKIIDKDKLHSVEREGVELERAVLKLAKHPNIVQLHSLLESKSQVHIVMELCIGDLSALTEKKGKLPEAEIKEIVRGLCAALAHLHDLGVIHRDVKPSNILLKRNEIESRNIRLADFGHSKFVCPSETVTGCAGTYKYWAPEVVTEGAKYSFPVDMWSVGVIVYRLLTGVHPFSVDDGEAVPSKPKTSYDTCNVNFTAASDDAKRFIRSLLHVDPDRRLTAKEALMHPFLALA